MNSALLQSSVMDIGYYVRSRLLLLLLLLVAVVAVAEVAATSAVA
jgi:hypothetical protein